MNSMFQGMMGGGMMDGGGMMGPGGNMGPPGNNMVSTWHQVHLFPIIFLDPPIHTFLPVPQLFFYKEFLLIFLPCQQWVDYRVILSCDGK